MMKRSAAAHLALLGLLGTTVLANRAAAAPMTALANVAPAQSVGIDVVLPLRDRAGLESLVAHQHSPGDAQFHRWLTPAQVNERFGPSAADVAAAVAALRQNGQSVTVKGGRMLQVQGTAGQINRLLRTNLAYGRTATGHTHLYARTTPRLPDAVAALGGLVIGLGIDPHEAHTMMQRVAVPAAALADPDNRSSATGGYWYDDLRQAYQYPSYQTMITKNGKQVRLDGTGTTIAILMSADIYDSDVNLIFNHENFTAHSGQPGNPSLYARVAVDGGALPSSESAGEAALDVQQALGGAPGAHVVLYEIPSLADQQIVDGYFQIVLDNTADVVSSSFGACELVYTAAYNNGSDFTQLLDVEHQLFLQGNAQGISFLASSGDNAGLTCPSANYVVDKTAGTFVPSVSVPAADPNVTAVGGTNLITAYQPGSLTSAYRAENAYSDPLVPIDVYGLGALVSGGSWGAGGGVSTLYARPSFQAAAPFPTGSTTMRALPDIGMQVGGCPSSEAVTPCNGGNRAVNGNGNTQRSFVWLALGGGLSGAIGTSVASPEFASAAALLVERNGRMGNLNTYIYQLAATQAGTPTGGAQAAIVYHQGIPGYNGVVTNRRIGGTGPNIFNYTTGNGTPMVRRFIGLPNAAPAGLPQTSSNP